MKLQVPVQHLLNEDIKEASVLNAPVSFKILWNSMQSVQKCL